MIKVTPPTGPRFRTDIQALRGFAVLIVLLYHAKFGLFSAGYLGVDVFFVISGFLITNLISQGLAKATFRFTDFYFRRAKRLLPAAYATFLATALLTPFFLTSAEMQDFQAQMAGAVTFTGNIVLLRQAGYFGGAAELKPLLHVWSLAIEEQFYLILPAFLAFVPRRLWVRLVVLILLASLTLCLVRAGRDSTFYLLQTRAWELAIGSLGALSLSGNRLRPFFMASFWPALALLLTLPLLPLGSYHPGWQAVLICVATLVVILGRHPVLFNGSTVYLFSRLGDVSYSLYLVHWPMFAFFNNVWFGDTESALAVAVRSGLVALSLMLAFLLNRYVEEPIRRAEVAQRGKVVRGSIAASVGLVAISAGMAYAMSPARDYADIRRPNRGFGSVCDFKQEFTAATACRNSAKPEILVWGDSVAMHLVPGLLGHEGGAPAVAQATKSGCGPLLGIAPVSENNEKWAEQCIRFNRSVASWLSQNDSIEIVVLSSSFSQYLDERARLLADHDETRGFRVAQTGLSDAIAGLRNTVEAVRAAGKRVVVVAPPPSGELDSSRCIERLERRLPLLGVDGDCSITVASYRKKNGRVLEFLAELEEQGGVEVVSFDSYLCGSQLCRTYVDGTLLYRDKGHLSYEGSVFLANAMSLLETIRRAAR